MADVPVGTDLQERAIGVLFLAIGAVAIYFFAWSPYVRMQAGAEEVSIRFMRAFFGPVAVVLGLMQVALGRGAARILGRGEFETTWRTFAAMAVMFGLGLATWFWLDAQATAFGYG